MPVLSLILSNFLDCLVKALLAVLLSLLPQGCGILAVAPTQQQQASQTVTQDVSQSTTITSTKPAEDSP